MPVNWAVSGRLDGAATRGGGSAAVRLAQIVGSETGDLEIDHSTDVLEHGHQLRIAGSREVGLDLAEVCSRSEEAV